MLNLLDMHAYVFTWHGDDLVYERTFSAACITQAQKWIRDSGRLGFITINCMPKNYFY